MRGNLAKMVDLSADSGAQVLLLGMRIPPNYGPEFTEKFFAVFAEVARDKRTPLVPFLHERHRTFAQPDAGRRRTPQ